MAIEVIPPVSNPPDAQPPQPPSAAKHPRRTVLRWGLAGIGGLLGIGMAAEAADRLGLLPDSAHAMMTSRDMGVGGNPEATPTSDTAFLKRFSEHDQATMHDFLDGSLNVPPFVQGTSEATSQPDHHFVVSTNPDGGLYTAQVIALGTYFDRTQGEYYGAFGIEDPSGKPEAIFLGKLGDTDTTPYTTFGKTYHVNDVIRVLPPANYPADNTGVTTAGGEITRQPMADALQQLEDKVGTRMYVDIIAQAVSIDPSVFQYAPLVFQQHLVKETGGGTAEAGAGLLGEGASFNVDPTNPGRSFLQRAGKSQLGLPGVYRDPTTRTLQGVGLDATHGITSPAPFISSIEFPQN